MLPLNGTTNVLIEKKKMMTVLVEEKILYLTLMINSPDRSCFKVSYFSSKTYIVGTENSRLNETVLLSLSTQNTCLN